MKNIGLILVVLVLIVAGYFVFVHQYRSPAISPGPTSTPTQSTQQTPKTQTYRNTEFGVEFEYPENWIINREHKSLTFYSKFFLQIAAPVVITTTNQERRIARDPAFLINIVLPEFVDSSFGDLEKIASDITVDGIGGIKYKYEYQGLPHTAVVLPFGEFKVILATGEGSRQYLDEFNQILASFKFLK